MHPDLPYDKKYSSHKHGGKAGLTYELAVSTIEQRLYWVAGPYPAGNNDKQMFRRSGLQEKLVSQGKRAVADGGYNGVEGGGVSTPNKQDTAATREYKRRVRARHESINARVKNFGILSQTFRHKIDRLDKHQTAFEAVCVIVQYQMENGSPLFEV
jgi:hypothetical protein